MDEVRIDGYCSVYCRDLAEVRKDTLREAADILEREARIQEERSEAYIAITLRELAQAILNLENNK